MNDATAIWIEEWLPGEWDVKLLNGPEIQTIATFAVQKWHPAQCAPRQLATLLGRALAAEMGIPFTSRQAALRGEETP